MKINSVSIFPCNKDTEKPEACTANCDFGHRLVNVQELSVSLNYFKIKKMKRKDKKQRLKEYIKERDFDLEKDFSSLASESNYI